MGRKGLGAGPLFRRRSAYICAFADSKNPARKRRGPVCRPPTGAQASPLPKGAEHPGVLIRVRVEGGRQEIITVTDRRSAGRGCCIEAGPARVRDWEIRMAKSTDGLALGKIAAATSFTGKKRI